MIRILMIEDEPLVAKRLKRFVENSLFEAHEISHVDSVSNAHRFLEKNEVQLLLLDLNLHGQNGFEVLTPFLNKSFHTIVVSAYTDKALEAFEHGVLDFIGKPFTQQRVQKAVDRFLSFEQSGTGASQRLAVRMKGGIEFIQVAEISFVRAAGIYCEIVMNHGAEILYDKPLNKLLQLLPSHFLRVHRSYAVDLEKIRSISRIKHNQYAVDLSSGASVPISREMREEIGDRLGISN